MVKTVAQLVLFTSLLFATGLCAIAGEKDPRDSLEQLLKTKLTQTGRVDVLNELAYNNFDVSDSMAMVYARQALKTAIEIKYPRGEKYAYTLIGLGLSSSGKHKQAISYFQKSDRLIVPQSESINSYNQMLWGTLYTDIGKYDSALYQYHRARLVAHKSPLDLQSIYKNLARLSILLWKNNEALQYLDSAKALSNYGDAYMEMELLGQYGLVYQNLLEFDKAKEYFDRLCTLADTNTDYYHKIECNLYQSRLHLIRGEYNQGLALVLDAISISNEYNYVQYVDVLIQAGEAYLEMSQLELSAQYFYQALKLSEDAELKHKTGIIFNNLAWINKIQRKYSDAIDYTNKAQFILEEIGDPIGVSESYNVRGLTYVLLEDYIRAEQQFKKSLKIREEINDQKGISASLYNLADLYLELERNKEALQLLYQVVEIEKKIGNKSNLSMTYGLIARQLVRDNRFKEAFDFLKKAEKEGEEDQSLYIKGENARSYAFYYRAIGDYKNAYLYQRKYQDVTDEIHDLEGTEKMAEYEALYKTKEREQEIELLNQRQRNQEDKIRVQQLSLMQKNIVIGSASIIIVLLGVIGWRGMRHNKKLISLNKEILQQKEEAERANAAKSEFLANVSHELRTPLNGVIGFSDLIHKTPLNESQQKYIGIVNQSAHTLLSLIDDILDFSKLDANKLQLTQDRVDLNKMAHQIADMMRHQTDKKTLALITSVSDRIPKELIADELRLRQVLTNLLANAIKFTHHGEVELKIISLKESEEEHVIRFIIRDTGIGIDPQNQKRIFDAFIQEDLSTTKKFGGTGLGLTISNKLLSLMNSKLSLHSIPGQGSTFSFDLTLAAH